MNVPSATTAPRPPEPAAPKASPKTNAPTNAPEGPRFADTLATTNLLPTPNVPLAAEPLPDAETPLDLPAPVPPTVPLTSDAAVAAAPSSPPPAALDAAFAGDLVPKDPLDPRRQKLRADPLDAATRHSAQLAPPLTSMGASSPAASSRSNEEQPARASLEAILPELVRKIAWAGDGKRGSMRLELGAGALEGGTLVVHADEGRVRVSLSTPAGTDVTAWRDRLGQRLAERGIAVDDLLVD